MLRREDFFMQSVVLPFFMQHQTAIISLTALYMIYNANT